MQNTKPDFKKIFHDVIDQEYPYKKIYCQKILSKETLTAIDIILLNKIIFEEKFDLNNRRVHRSYSYQDIDYILKYQNNNKLNNSQMSSLFGISRNSIAKWKNIWKKIS